MGSSNRILLVAPHSIVEPLGLFYLSTVARQEGWEPKIFLTKFDYDELNNAMKDFNPSIVGFTVYTGIHKQIFSLLDLLKKDFPGITTIIGGPHATCFPHDCASHSNHVVVGEGLNSLRTILHGTTSSVLVCNHREQFPISDRMDFYASDKKHRESPIKSVIANFGCPFDCSYCYNSMDKNLFPLLFRSVDDVITEVTNVLSIVPNTKTIFFQDDVFGMNVSWLEEFAEKYSKINTPFHCQTRFEFLNPSKDDGLRRLNLLKQAGCSGITLAIESSNPIIRKEILGRTMDNALIFDTMVKLSELGFRVRTEQMLGIPYGATSVETPINLDADIDTLEFNIQLRESTGLPTVAWASILMPYKGTRIWDYCDKYGFYHGSNDDIPKSFFERSVLKFPDKWVGSNLSDSDSNWMNSKDSDDYKDKMYRLQSMFHLAALMPSGHKLVRRFLDGDATDNNLNKLLTTTKYHLYENELYQV